MKETLLAFLNLVPIFISLWKLRIEVKLNGFKCNDSVVDANKKESYRHTIVLVFHQGEKFTLIGNAEVIV